MTHSTGLLSQRPTQASLFGSEENRMQAPRQDTRPDPEDVRRRLRTILEKAREAETMPWSERNARMWRTVFPNMANGCRKTKVHGYAKSLREKWIA